MLLYSRLLTSRIRLSKRELKGSKKTLTNGNGREMIMRIDGMSFSQNE